MITHLIFRYFKTQEYSTVKREIQNVVNQYATDKTDGEKNTSWLKCKKKNYSETILVNDERNSLLLLVVYLSI